MSVYEAFTKVDYKNFKYHINGKKYPRDHKYISVKTNSVTFMAHKQDNEPTLTYCFEELKVRKQGNTYHILERKGKPVITFTGKQLRSI